VLAVDIGADLPELGYPTASRDELEAVVADARGDVAAFTADVRDRDALDAAVAEAEHRWGGLDAAIGCAGAIGGGVPQWELAPGVEQLLLDINLGGTMNLARAAIPALLRRPEPRAGRFVAVASTAATHGLPMLAAYCAAKAGIVGLVRALAAELGRTGVTANTISPGSTATPILDQSARLYGLEETDEFATHASMQRLLDPAEIAAVIAFLVSEHNAAMTGAVIPVDGGFDL
jgi:SDR family mycofactocin-dependent oxidoreductase